MSQESFFFAIFIGFICVVLALDLGIFSKSNKPVTFKNALAWTAVWVSFGLLFFLYLKAFGNNVHGIYDQEKLTEIAGRYQPDLVLNSGSFEDNLILYKDRISIDYLTGYFIEYSLSVDNLFVILLIFNSFAVPDKYFKKVLFWGVLGAIILRMLFIFSGSLLIDKFHWVLYVFGAFLIYSGVRILTNKEKDDEMDIEGHPMVRLASRYFSIWPEYVRSKFVHRDDGKMHLTPLFLVLLVVEFSDVVFAIDSVPAIFSVTKDPYIVFFSNIFAIMGLRSLFFLLSNIMHLFAYLKYGLGVLLSFIGIKMLFEHWFEMAGIDNLISLMIIFGILSVSILLSLIFPKKAKH